VKEKDIEIINKLGLHARAAAKLVTTAGGFSASVTIGMGERKADAKSIMEVMMLAATKGTTLHVVVDGEDEEPALDAVAELIDGRFGEPE
jgi:phosphocarrier protein